MLNLFDRFRPGQPATAVPSSWYNAVARFLNNLRGEGVNCQVEVTRPGDPSEANPPVIRVTVPRSGGAELSNALPLADSELGAPGADTKASRSDHIHPIFPEFWDVYDWATGAESAIQGFESDIGVFYGWWSDLAVWQLSAGQTIDAHDQLLANLDGWAYMADGAIAWLIDYTDWNDGRVTDVVNAHNALSQTVFTLTGDMATVKNAVAVFDDNFAYLAGWMGQVEDDLDYLFSQGTGAIWDWINTHVQQENAAFGEIWSELGYVYDDIGGLYSWANSNFSTLDSNMTILNNNQSVLYNNFNVLDADINALYGWSNTFAGQMNTAINQIWNAVNAIDYDLGRIWSYWRGGYFG